MDDTHVGHAGPLSEKLPAREHADHQVAAGAIAGLVAGAAMWLVAMGFAHRDLGLTAPLRLVAASFMGTVALDSGAGLGPVALGLLLVGMTSVVFGLGFTSVLPERLDAFAACLAGVAYAAAVWLPAWHVLVRVADPVLFAAVSGAHMLVLHAIYGLVLGLVLPPLRRILP